LANASRIIPSFGWPAQKRAKSSGSALPA